MYVLFVIFTALPPRPPVGGARRRKARRADTNILAVKFNTLTGPSAVHTGDAVVCSNPSCTAILSHLSSLSQPASASPEEEDSSRVSLIKHVQVPLL